MKISILYQASIITSASDNRTYLLIPKLQEQRTSERVHILWFIVHK